MRLGQVFPPLASLNVPNAVTTLAAAAGLAAAGAALLGSPRLALACLFAGIVSDRLDGVLARRLGQTTALGRELDSLADAIGFGVAPAAIALASGFQAPHELAALGLYVLAALWRLAHFNVTGLEGSGADERFSGIPTTLAGSFFLIVAAALRHAGLRPAVERGVLLAFFVAAAVLMVSAVPFRKAGLVTRSLYVLLPLALAAVVAS